MPRHLGRTHRRLGSGAPPEQPPAEGDAAHGKPGPAECGTGDHIREPVHVEQHAAARDRYGDRDRSGGQERASRVTAAPPDQQRRGGVERCRRRRVPAGKRGPECCRDRVQGGSNSVDEVLHGQRQGGVAGDHDDEIRDDPAAASTHPLHGGKDCCEGDHEPRLTERGHELDAAGREGRRVLVTPVGDAVVDSGELRARSHGVREHAEQDPAPDDEQQSEREGEPGRRARAQAGFEQPPQAGVPMHRMTDRARSRERGPRCGAGAGVLPREREDQGADRRRNSDENEQRHEQCLPAGDNRVNDGDMSTGLANARRPSADGAPLRRRAAATGTVFPVLDPRPGGMAERLSSRLGGQHPIIVFLAAIVAGYAALAAMTIGLGLLPHEGPALCRLDPASGRAGRGLDRRQTHTVTCRRLVGWVDNCRRCRHSGRCSAWSCWRARCSAGGGSARSSCSPSRSSPGHTA